MKLPNELYVRWEGEGDDIFLMTGKTVAELLDSPPDKQTIGVYKLDRTVSAETTVTLTTK